MSGFVCSSEHLCFLFLCLLCCIFRLAHQNEGEKSKLKDILSGDQCPQKLDESLNQSELTAPNKEEDNNEENESERDRDKLSSSVIIEMPDVQPSLELSTITGTSTNGILF